MHLHLRFSITGSISYIRVLINIDIKHTDKRLSQKSGK